MSVRLKFRFSVNWLVPVSLVELQQPALDDTTKVGNERSPDFGELYVMIFASHEVARFEPTVCASFLVSCSLPPTHQALVLVCPVPRQQ